MTKSICVLAALAAGCVSMRAQIGAFEGQSEVGKILHPGSAVYDPAKKTYLLTGSGDNMWEAEDDFHFVWKKVTGDVSLAADVSIVTATGEPHRKGLLMVRRTLDQDSEYVDAALHGNGISALQSRDKKGAITREVISAVTGATRLGLVKRGSYVYMTIAGPGEQPHPAGGSMKFAVGETFYVGLAACAHNKDATVQVAFSNVQLETGASAQGQPKLYSTVETVPVAVATDRKVVYSGPGRLESPMWARDGKALLLTNAGKLATIALTGKPDTAPVSVNTASLSKIGHHTAISPDGALLGFTDETGNKTAIYTVPLAGGAPKLITDKGSSYFQGWSPDGQKLLFCGPRNGKTQILTISEAGGEEAALGTPNNNNDSPEYSPDGKFIYFNSDRTGTMQIWRMTADGKDETQMTTDEFSNWFPHVSPDGTQIAYMSYDKGVAGHPNDTDIHVRTMNLTTKAVELIADFTGGPASVHSAGWSPDSQNLALVSYQMVK